MNKDFEKFKRQLAEGTQEMVSMPIVNYDEEEDKRIMVAVLLHRGELQEGVETADKVLNEADTREELLQYLEEERTRAAISLKKLDDVINGGWA